MSRMRSTAIKKPVSDLLSIVEEYVVVDGYYTRSDELHVRGTAVAADNGWQQLLKQRFEALGGSLRIDESGPHVYLTIYAEKKGFPWLHLVLFAATLFTVSISYVFFDLMIGNWSGVVAGLSDPAQFWAWQPFTASLLTILLFHEFGHYFAAKRRGIRVTLPYFIPAPTLIGTFGAFIKSKSPFTSRRDLIEVGAWGPVAGFVVAVVILAISMTRVVAVPPTDFFSEGSQIIEPLIFRLLEPIFMTQSFPSDYVIPLPQNPMLFAAWVGLFVTALNLLPVGQLDGGHIVYALSPRLHGLVSRGVFIALAGFGFLWQGWWLWAALVFFVIRFKHPPTMNDYAPVSRGSKWLGWAAIVIFLLTFTPSPL